MVGVGGEKRKKKPKTTHI